MGALRRDAAQHGPERNDNPTADCGSASGATNDIRALGYRTVDVARATGVTLRQLDYWRVLRVVTPSVRPTSPLAWSRQDVVALAVLIEFARAGGIANSRYPRREPFSEIYTTIMRADLDGEPVLVVVAGAAHVAPSPEDAKDWTLSALARNRVVTALPLAPIIRAVDERLAAIA